jgi:acetyltransferase
MNGTWMRQNPGGERQNGRAGGWLRTRSGELLKVRLIRPDDAALLESFVRSLTPESRRRRFHANVERVSGRIIRQRTQEMADVDNLTLGGAVLALTQDAAGSAQIVGVARLGRSHDKPDDPRAEAAIIVRDDYQDQGVGSGLLRELVKLAQRMKVKQMVANIEVDNQAALRLFRGLGLPTRSSTSLGETMMIIDMPG